MLESRVSLVSQPHAWAYGWSMTGQIQATLSFEAPGCQSGSSDRLVARIPPAGSVSATSSPYTPNSVIPAPAEVNSTFQLAVPPGRTVAANANGLPSGTR